MVSNIVNKDNQDKWSLTLLIKITKINCLTIGELSAKILVWVITIVYTIILLTSLKHLA